MFKAFTAVILAASLTLTAAAPAQADYNRNQQVAGGVLALILLGIAIDHANNNDDNDRGRVHRNPNPNANQRVALPRRCLREANDVRRNARVVMRDCLNTQYTSAHTLPRACRVNVHTRHGNRQAYDMPCMRDRGFRVAR
jgi:hypothetical protein